MKKSFTTQRITRLGVFTAAALILTLVEHFLPPLLFFAPGVKVGLANAAILAALILLGPVDALVVLAAKCILGALFAGNPAALMYSVPAGLVSFGVQYLLYRFVFPKIGVVSVSLTGAVTHNAVQLLVASLVVKQSLFYFLPFTLIASVIAGLFIGFAVFFLVKYLPRRIMNSE